MFVTKVNSQLTNAIAANRCWANQRGNLTLLLIVSLTFLTLITYSLLALMQQLGTQSRDTSRHIIYKAALYSAINYTRAGMKRRWCFSPTWDQEPSLVCDLAHPRSSERLLLSNLQIEYIQELLAHKVAMPVGNPIALTSFAGELEIDKLGSAHPLKTIFTGPEFDFLDKIKFSVTRLDDPDLPVVGTEVHVQIEAAFIARAGFTLPTKRGEMKAWTKVTLYPREVGTFALLVANDLILDGKGASGLGDVAFPLGLASQPGVIFESPVFVNGSIHIPANNSTSFTNVTFSDPVIIGGGILKQNLQPAVPLPGAGVFGQLASDMVGFGGFQRGISIDGVRDEGLDVFAGIKPGAMPNDDLMKKCISRNQLKSDLTLTKSSRLLIKESNPTTWNFSFSYDDYFNEQRKRTFSPTATGKFYSVPTFDPVQDKPIMKVVMTFTNTTLGATRTVVSELGRQGKVTVSPQMFQDSNAYISAINSVPPPTSAQKAELQKRFAAAEAAEKNPPLVEVKTNRYMANGYSQENQALWSVDLTNAKNLAADFTIQVTPYDVAFTDGMSTRKGSALIGPTPVTFSWKRAGPDYTAGDPAPTFNAGKSWTRADGSGGSPAELEVLNDWNELERLCNPINDSYAFQPSAWDYSFAPTTRYSWNINPASLVEFDASNSPGPSPAFNVKSIASLCVIRRSATLVTGFFACDRLIVEARSQPLQIIGTFIVGSAIFDPSVYKAGLRWSNIYNPNAVETLRSVRILLPRNNKTVCNMDPNKPFWHPNAAIADQEDLYNCNSISLRALGDPFTWSTVDPDCGIQAAAAATSCKRRPIRFTTREFDQGYLL